MIDSNANALGHELTVNWVDGNANGDAISKHDVLRSLDNITYSVIASDLAGSAIQYVDTLLDNGRLYYYKIREYNRDGSVLSSEKHKSSSGKPDAPTLTDVSLTDLYQLTISWDALDVAPSDNANDQGKPITQYKLYRDGSYLASITNGDLFYVDNNLSNGVQYKYKLSATNENSDSDKSNEMSNIPSSNPDIVANVVAVHGDRQATVSWDLLAVAPSQLPNDQGSAILGYILNMSTDNVNFSPVNNNQYTVNGSINTFTVLNLINGTRYYFQVIASSLAGNSSAQQNASSCIASRSPDTVRNLNITSESNLLDITWDKPADDRLNVPSGDIPYLYRIDLLLDGTVVQYKTGLSVTNARFLGLMNSTTYVVSIYAYNAQDTDPVLFNKINQSAQVVPRPIEISDLAWDNQAVNQIAIKFSYDVVLYSVTKFLLTFYDVNLGRFGSILLDSHDPSIRTLNSNTNLYDFSIVLTATNTQLIGLQSSDTLQLTCFVRNSFGLSNVSNTVQTN